MSFASWLLEETEANPTIAIYNASAVKMYNATSSLELLKQKYVLLYV
jgi:hypothetical protein